MQKWQRWQRNGFSKQCRQQKAQAQGSSAGKAAEALGAKLKALSAEAIAEAMAAENVRVKEELLSQL